MTEAHVRSYDDLPESDVATVLQVPLLWGGGGSAAGGSPPSTSRHRLPEQGPVAAATVVPAGEDAPAVSRGRVAHPMLQVVQVGVVSALLVLALFGAALLALAAWMP